MPFLTVTNEEKHYLWHKKLSLTRFGRLIQGNVVDHCMAYYEINFKGKAAETAPLEMIFNEDEIKALKA